MATIERTMPAGWRCDVRGLSAYLYPPGAPPWAVWAYRAQVHENRWTAYYPGWCITAASGDAVASGEAEVMPGESALDAGIREAIRVLGS
jgi:hypothetical protein